MRANFYSWIRTAPLLCLALFVTACVTGRTADDAPLHLAGLAWQVVDQSVADLPGRQDVASLTFTPVAADHPGQVSGFDGCNRVSGQYRWQETGGLVFSGMIATRRACLPERAALETAFRRAFAQTRTFHREGDRLRLQDAQGATLLELQVSPAGITAP